MCVIAVGTRVINRAVRLLVICGLCALVRWKCCTYIIMVTHIACGTYIYVYVHMLVTEQALSITLQYLALTYFHIRRRYPARHPLRPSP